MARLVKGDMFPDFKVNTIFGADLVEGITVKEITGGKPTMFWFLRYMGCPPCRLDVHLLTMKKPEFDAKGVNIGAFHYALMFNKPEDNKALDDLIGGHYQKGFSYNPFYEAKFEIENNHEVLNGVKSFGYYDEWHFNIAFSDDKNKKFIPLIKTKVPDKIRRRRSAPESVRAEFGKDKLETIAWLVENQNGTRGFGIMGGHVVWTLAHKDYRKLLLNMIAWLAEIDVSPNGYDATFTDFDTIASKITKDKRGDYQYYIKDWRDFDAKCRAEK